jgi:hypothetical protein
MSVMLHKLTGANLRLLLPHLRLAYEHANAIGGVTDVVEALDQLQRHSFLDEAATLLAHALPKREAVWWACVCADHTRPADLSAADLLARAAAEAWVRRQRDELRVQAMEHAQAAGCQTPEAWSAVAAFWSGGADGPVNEEDAPPDDHLTGTAVTGALRLAAVRNHPNRQVRRLRRFLDSGRAIAAGQTGRLPLE